MILTFSRGAAATALALALAGVLGCTRAEERRDEVDARARTAEVIGALKLLRQEYTNAVAPQGAAIIDATEYAESELFAEQAEAKFGALARKGGVSDPKRAAAIAEGLARLRGDVASKAPHAAVVGQATATLALVEELLAGAVPESIRGTVLASSRADAAIAAEEVVGEYRIGITAGPARKIFVRRDRVLVAAPPAPAGASYVAALLRERRTKRFLPAAEVALVIEGDGRRTETALTEVWGDFHQYGANVVVPADGPVTVTVRVSPPAYARHGDMLTHFVAPVTATMQGHVRQGALAFDAKPLQPTDPDYALGDDVLQAVAEAGTLRDAGPYRVGVIVEGPEPIWTWQNGAPVLKPVAAGATNHVEIVLLDRETGQLVPSADVALTFLADGESTGSATLHPLLSIFSHYGETLVLPPRSNALRARIDPPHMGALDRPRLADPVEVELPLPGRAKGGA
jgi:hypothetical protein